MASGSKSPTVKKNPSAKPASRVLVLVSTRKGAWLFHGDGARKAEWRSANS